MFYECRDPEGRLVLLSERLWRAEICRDHPAVYGEMEAVIATVEEPDIICEDADYPRARLLLSTWSDRPISELLAQGRGGTE
jgi:hypothetical protein